MPVNKLHLQAVEQVRASYQSRAYAVIEPMLDEEELAALKRGRNISSIKPPKNGNMTDYRRATGLECLNASTSCLKRLTLRWSQPKR